MPLFGTKAETLRQLAPLLQWAQIPELFHFSVGEWSEHPKSIQWEIQDQFDGAAVAVRSSAQNEDAGHQSMAGAYKSVLNVPSNDPDAVANAVAEVIGSYRTGNPGDQVLIQSMLKDVALSGVIMTADLASGAPYYIINYDDESGRTDAITGGTGVNKTVVIHHDAAPEFIESPRIQRVLSMIHELERIFGRMEPLDIEFAQTSDGILHVLQVRRIAVQKNWNRAVRARLSEALEHITAHFIEAARPRVGLAGSRTILGQMPDWNPAELIGPRPAPLALSLFQHLITNSEWREARALMGYRRVEREPLLTVLAGRPYVDVRSSFNSFLPAGLGSGLETRLLDAWLQRLEEHPEFHDKVEFEVTQTVLDFTFHQDHESRYAEALTAEEFREFHHALHGLTAANIKSGAEGSLGKAMASLSALSPTSELRAQHPLRQASLFLEHAKRCGTLPFCAIARHAFMAESLLRSAVRRGALHTHRLDAFKGSLDTVASQLGRDFSDVTGNGGSREAFLARYGHLRPGTFDILSPRYDQRLDLFDKAPTPSHCAGPLTEPFHLETDEARALDALLQEILLPIDASDLLQYAREAIRGREQAKFIFTQDLSNALECIAEWGERIGLSRESLAYLTWDDLVSTLNTPIVRDVETHFHELAGARRMRLRELGGLRLGYIIRGAKDLYVVPLHRGAPNFVTRNRIEAEVILIDARTLASADLYGRIAFIENADPGFDWIFTKGIVGLVTKFGGANSHMTIRCAELGLPAAVGVGEQTFEHLLASGRIELRCDEKLLRPCYV